MGGKIDLTGQKFHRLTVIAEEKHYSGDKAVYWLCQCDCGNTCVVKGHVLRAGKTKSCGCFRRDRAKEATGKMSAQRSIKLTIDNTQAKTFSELAQQSDIPAKTIYRRWRDGWPVDKLTAPLRSTNKHNRMPLVVDARSRTYERSQRQEWPNLNIKYYWEER